MSTVESEKTMDSYSWKSSGITDTGKSREHNEDAMLESPETGLWVVADGMGGHAAGDVASQMIIETLGEIPKDIRLDRFIDEVEDRLLKVNDELLERANASEKPTTIGSTVVSLILYDRYSVFIWAGDSRLYRLRNNELRQVTTDHSQVELYVEKGLITREEALAHPHGNMITRAVGAMKDLYLDMDIQELERQDRYLLCSDGLTKHLTDFEIEDILKEGNEKEACEALIDQTLERGAGDNVTAIVVDVY